MSPRSSPGAACRFLLGAALPLALCLASAAGCGPRLDCPAPQPSPADGETLGKYPLTLYVSNQSLDVDPIDIQVHVDDWLRVCDLFSVGSQHSWREYTFVLAPGGHHLAATSAEGAASLRQSFTTSGQHWAVLDYWYEDGQEATPRHFSLTLSDQPISFQ